MKKRFNYIEISILQKKVLLLFIDIAIVLLCVFPILENGIPFSEKIHSFKELIPYFYSVILYLILVLFLDFYNINYIFNFKKILPISLLFGSVFSLIYILTPYIVPNLNYRKIDIILLFISTSFGLAIWRFIFVKVFSNNNFYKNILLFVGDDYPYNEKELKDILHGDNFNNGLRVKGVINLDNYSSDYLKKMIDKNILYSYSMVILAVKDYSKISDEINFFLNECFLKNIVIKPFYKSYEDIFSAIPFKIAQYRLYDIFFMGNSNNNFFYKFFNIFIDYIFSIILGTFTLCIIPIIYFLNLLFNRGPLFYSQIRIGKNGKEIKIYKFRSMIPHDESKYSVYVQHKDSRVTKWGKFLRKIRIDELPQIYNVLKREMSFIGPRAEWKNLVIDYKKNIPFFEMRHLIRPGITGWAQINYKYGDSLEDTIRKLEYDLYYIKNRSVLLDLMILFKTVNSVLFLKGK